jgi:hypothetical protein
MTSSQVPIINQTKLSLLSAAAVLCGEKPLNSLTDQRYAASVGAALFDMTYENELQSNRWRFACKKDQLSQVNSIPINEWRFCFQLPPDMLLPIGFYGLGPDRLYDIYADVIYTNVSSGPGPSGTTSQILVFDYMFKPDPATIPSYFALLVSLALAKLMVKPITESDSAQTKLEQAYNVQRGRAMYADAQGRPNRPLQNQPFTEVR